MDGFFGTVPDVFSAGLIVGTVGGGVFTFTHPEGTIADDLTAAYRWSTDLENFNADGALVGGTQVDFTTQLDTPSGFTTVTATVTVGPIPEKLFVDVLVTQN